MFSGLSFSIASGDMIHLQGSNGVGKSSLLRLLAGFLPPFAGQISAQEAGEQVSVQTLVTLLEEQPALKAGETLAETLRHWTGLMGGLKSHQNCLEAADTMGIGSLMEMETRRFSTGQRRRSALCRLPLSSRPIWLMDEPFNGLDKVAQGLVANMIDHHRNTGGSVVIASHGDIDSANARIALNEYLPVSRPVLDVDMLEERW